MILIGSCLLLFVLWLPGLAYPVVSDTSFYALLGESLWKFGRYELLDVPYAKHLPLHAFLSYPFVSFLSYSVGMKSATLVAGIVTLLLTYLVVREAWSETVALIAVPLVAVHHGFVLMTILGSADLLFTALFLAMVYALLRAEEDQRWYVVAGIAIGCASLARYNGVPLFFVFGLLILLWRREDLASPWPYVGAFLGVILFSAWLWRNALVFGNPFHSSYTSELAVESNGVLQQIWSNALYYLDPFHNILPILMVAAAYGLVLEWRRQPVLILSIAGAWVLTAIWWVQAIRFAFPAYPILIGFSVVGLRHIQRIVSLPRSIVLTLLTLGIVTSHAGALCLYTYGGCNSFVDRTIGILPKNMGLSSEGFFTWGRALDAANRLLPERAIVAVGDTTHLKVEQQGFFREDLRLVETSSADCPYHRITQNPADGEEILFVTEDHPKTYLTKTDCLNR